ncbi:MAG: IS1380 family transposase [Candidatus Hydrogenedentes bacterium]|nr:IS1380 family transposase [Candidatus Hydrogenedentota bacterium]
MKTECNAAQLEFQGHGRRKVVADFDGGHLSSDGGALLLREVDARLNILPRFAACFTDHRDPELIDHSVLELARQRTFGLALGYEDLNDHKELMADPLLAMAVGKQDIEGKQRHKEKDRGKALASQATLNRLELTPDDASCRSRYKKIVYHAELIEALLVDVFLESFAQAPEEIVLDFDATDDPVHGSQEGRFFHGYYGCYCYLPLYVTCGEHLLVAKLRKANIDASAGSVEVLASLVQRIRERWPKVRIILRGDSGFARDAIMAWCETNDVYYVLGLAKNARLLRIIAKELAQAKARYLLTGAATRVFTDFMYRTQDSWTNERRVIAKAEQLAKGANPRFIVTNLPEEYGDPKTLYEQIYCARGDMENRIKEQQLDLFADRTSSHTMRANQLRLWFSSMAYVLMSALRRIGLKGTRLARATCGTIRLKLLKIGAKIWLTVRRIVTHLPSAYPYKDVFIQALRNLQHYPLRT